MDDSNSLNNPNPNRITATLGGLWKSVSDSIFRPVDELDCQLDLKLVERQPAADSSAVALFFEADTPEAAQAAAAFVRRFLVGGNESAFCPELMAGDTGVLFYVLAPNFIADFGRESYELLNYPFPGTTLHIYPDCEDCPDTTAWKFLGADDFSANLMVDESALVENVITDFIVRTNKKGMAPNIRAAPMAWRRTPGIMATYVDALLRDIPAEAAAENRREYVLAVKSARYSLDRARFELPAFKALAVTASEWKSTPLLDVDANAAAACPMPGHATTFLRSFVDEGIRRIELARITTEQLFPKKHSERTELQRRADLTATDFLRQNLPDAPSELELLFDFTNSIAPHFLNVSRSTKPADAKWIRFVPNNADAFERERMAFSMDKSRPMPDAEGQWTTNNAEETLRFYAASYIERHYGEKRQHTRRTLQSFVSEAAIQLRVGSPFTRLAPDFELDSNPYLLGIIGADNLAQVAELTTGRTRPMRRSDFILRYCGVTPSNSISPTFVQFLESITTESGGDTNAPIPTARRQVLADFIIDAAIGRNPKVYFLILQGIRANGKTQYFRIIERALGEYAGRFNDRIFSDTEHLTQLHGLRGLRFAYLDDLRGSTTLNCSLIRQLTGGGKTKSRGMNENYAADWNFTASMAVATNPTPRLDRPNQADGRRLIRLILPRQFRQDDAMQARLDNCAADALRFIIDNAPAHIQRINSGGEAVRVAPCLKSESADWILESAPILQWLLDNLEKGEQNGASRDVLSIRDIQQRYRESRAESGDNDYDVSVTAKSVLAALGEAWPEGTVWSRYTPNYNGKRIPSIVGLRFVDTPSEPSTYVAVNGGAESIPV